MRCVRSRWQFKLLYCSRKKPLYCIPVIMIKKCSLGKYRCFSRLWQQGLNFVNLPLLGSCTCSHSNCPEAHNARVKHVVHSPLVSEEILTTGYCYFVNCFGIRVCPKMSAYFTLRSDLLKISGRANMGP